MTLMDKNIDQTFLYKIASLGGRSQERRGCNLVLCNHTYVE